ncbi:MAG TPA: glycosyltransferase [Vicinamibacterales bacterium]|jgi:hypothetical protein|nr:glycosyltransferase [Vicinamibacterales bacterium]
MRCSRTCFYVPSTELVDAVPPSISQYWAWIDEVARTLPAKLANDEGDCTRVGPYNWTVQTFIYLRDAGFPCELSASVPEEGIIITHGDFLPRSFAPSARQFLVEIKPDRELQCRFANFVIVQNRHDPIRYGLRRLLVPAAFVHFWPQPGLLGREESRADTFENVCFIGNSEEFLPGVEVLAAEIRKLGLHWRMVPREHWHDYRQVDAVVAVRPRPARWSRRRNEDPSSDPNRKPASKLLNAWRAGVPAVLSPDIAFGDLRRSELDYLEARDVPEIILRLKRLKDDAALRRSMAANGTRRAADYTAEHNARAWQNLIQREIGPRFASWVRSPWRRKWFYFARARMLTLNVR